jgi:hypothetical protein
MSLFSGSRENIPDCVKPQNEDVRNMTTGFEIAVQRIDGFRRFSTERGQWDLKSFVPFALIAASTSEHCIPFFSNHKVPEIIRIFKVISKSPGSGGTATKQPFRTTTRFSAHRSGRRNGPRGETAYFK